MTILASAQIAMLAPGVDQLSLKSDFDKHYGERTYKENEWEDYAGWTLPYLYLIDEIQGKTELQRDYQSVGAQATNHLANKIAMVLFRPGMPFFRLDLTPEQLEELEGEGLSGEDVDLALSLAEKEGSKQLAKNKLRTAIMTALKTIIVLGDSLMYLPKNKPAQVYNLKDYIILRDMSGVAYKIITRDTHVLATLPEDVRNLVVAGNPGIVDEDAEVSIYTGVERQSDGRYSVWQEIDNLFRVPRKIGMYTSDELPWIPITWNLTRGYNYGTGLVEEYAGDFHTFSNLAEALVNLSSIVSDIKILVNPMGQTDVEDLNDSASGTYVYGNAEDISFLQLEKFQDMNFLHQQMETYARRIGAGFLFNTAVTRDAERVTAEEIRLQANELEGSLGGVYSHLAEDMQLPIAKRVMIDLDEAFKDIEPTIITGMESLTRTSELDQMMLFFGDLAMLAELPPEISRRLNYREVMNKLGAARQVDYKDFMLTEDEVKQNREEDARLETQGQANVEAAKAQNQTTTF